MLCRRNDPRRLTPRPFALSDPPPHRTAARPTPGRPNKPTAPLRRIPMRMVRVSGAWIAVVAALVLSASTASAAFNLRSPQVAIGGGSLQGYLNGVGESINVTTDQLDAQVWTSSISGNSTFTLMIELAGNAASNNIGIYNTNGGPVP